MMTMEKRNINIAHISLTDSEISAAVDVLKSGYLRQGKHCAAFEEEFAEKVGAKHAITSANGSAALHLAYMTILEPGDEVLVPSMTFIATASMVTAAGGVPVFCDVEEDTYLLDLKDAENKITEKTRAVAPVHLFGNACDIEAVQTFAQKHDLIIVWDAAQAHGATYKGQDVGSFDDFVCYSFYPSKNIFVGEGGMTTTNDPDYEYRMRFLRTHGQTGKYYHTMIGLNYRMTDVEAVIGREQLKRLDEMLLIRRRNGNMLHQGLADIPGLSVQKKTPHSEHAWHQYGAVIDPETFGKDKETVREELKKLGVATGIAYPRGLHQQPIFEEMYGKMSLLITEKLCENIINLPVHHGLSIADVEYVIEAVKTVQAKA